MFLIAQFLGILILTQNIDVKQTEVEGKTTFKEIPFVERPPIQENHSYIPILLAVLIGTGILLLLIRFNLTWVWKIWFLLAITIALTIAFGSFIPYSIALFLALLLSLWKIFKPNVWIQNITELFIYGGLAVIFVPIFNIFSGVILLILIALYDAYAVWKSKHMIKMAKSQTKAKVFAGFLIPYQLKRNILPEKVKTTLKKTLLLKVKTKSSKGRVAMLGGGDVAFPLIFAGVILKEMGLWQSLLVPFFALSGLIILFKIGKEKKFYPAMPFISSGCLIGLAVLYLLNYIL